MLPIRQLHSRLHVVSLQPWANHVGRAAEVKGEVVNGSEPQRTGRTVRPKREALGARCSTAWDDRPGAKLVWMVMEEVPHAMQDLVEIAWVTIGFLSARLISDGSTPETRT